MADFQFRTMRASDHPAVAALWRESAALMGLGEAFLPPVPDLEGRLAADFGEGWSVTLAFEAGTLAGFLAVHPADRVLGQIFLAPAFIGQGLGSAFFRMAKDRMPDGFTLYTPAANRRARAFYERGGMQVTHTKAHPEFGHEIVYYAWPGV